VEKTDRSRLVERQRGGKNVVVERELVILSAAKDLAGEPRSFVATLLRMTKTFCAVTATACQSLASTPAI
jgi:hypothetical protein